MGRRGTASMGRVGRSRARRRCGSTVEQLICNQWVAGSIPVTGSRTLARPSLVFERWPFAFRGLVLRGRANCAPAARRAWPWCSPMRVSANRSFSKLEVAWKSRNIGFWPENDVSSSSNGLEIAKHRRQPGFKGLFVIHDLGKCPLRYYNIGRKRPSRPMFRGFQAIPADRSTKLRQTLATAGSDCCFSAIFKGESIQRGNRSGGTGRILRAS